MKSLTIIKRLSKSIWSRIIFGLLAGVLIWILIHKVFTFVFPFGKGEDTPVAYVNSLVSCLAFAGLIITILLQQQELIATRAEFKQQNATFSKQRFETSFFNLLSVHHSIVDKIVIVDENRVNQNSRDAIRYLYGQFTGLFIQWYRDQGSTKITSANFGSHKDALIDSFREVFSKFEHYIGHYLSNLRALMDVIHQSSLIEDDERKFYFLILQAQLGPYEILFLYYYFNAGPGQFKKEYFNLLELGRVMNPVLLPIPDHSWIFDELPSKYMLAKNDKEEQTDGKLRRKW